MFPTTIKAQSWETIQHSGQYLWGMGYGSTVTEADNNALADLISKIATHVQSDFQQEESETTNGNKNKNIKIFCYTTFTHSSNFYFTIIS